MNSLGRDFSRIASLKPNWDSYGGAPVSPGLIQAARKLVDELPAEAKPERVTPSAGGKAILLKWGKRDSALLFEISSPDFGVSLIRSPDSPPVFGQLPPCPVAIEAMVLQWIASVRCRSCGEAFAAEGG